MKTKTQVDIPGFEGLYYVTSDGDVFNKRTGRKLKYRKKKFDRYVVALSKDNKMREFSMSWIMRMCFFDGRDGRIMHLDRCKSNFSLNNIKLTNQSEISKRNRGGRYRAVVHRKPDGTEDIYESTVAAAKALFVSKSCISLWCNKKVKNPIVEGEFFYEEETCQQ